MNAFEYLDIGAVMVSMMELKSPVFWDDVT